MLFKRYQKIKKVEDIHKIEEGDPFAVKRTFLAKRRTHLANERTFLAWIRTALSVMAFGFLVEKFSLFLWINLKITAQKKVFSLAISNLLGVIMVGLGAIIGLLSLIRYLRVEKEIESDTFRPSIILDTLFGLLFFILSAIICYYIFNWNNILIIKGAN